MFLTKKYKYKNKYNLDQHIIVRYYYYNYEELAILDRKKVYILICYHCG